MTRRPTQSIMANPVLVGAVSVLVLATAVFLAYNAHKGLPFVPTPQPARPVAQRRATCSAATTSARAAIASASSSRRRPVRLAARQGRRRGARSSSTRRRGPLPRDTTVAVRGRSVLGLQVPRASGAGRSSRTLPENGLDRRRPTPALSEDLDRFLGMYDAATRDGVRRSLSGYGGALATRGDELNATIEQASELLRHLDVDDDGARGSRGPARPLRHRAGRRRVRDAPGRRSLRTLVSPPGADTFAALSASPEALDRTMRDDPRDAARRRRSRCAGSARCCGAFARLSVALDGHGERLPATLPAPHLARDDRRAHAPRGHEGQHRRGTGADEAARAVHRPADLGCTARGEGDERHPRPARALRRPLRHGLQLLQHRLHPRGDAGQRGRPHRYDRAHARGPRAAPGQLDGLDRRHGARQRQERHLRQSAASCTRTLYSAAIDRQGNADCESGQRGFLQRVNVLRRAARTRSSSTRTSPATRARPSAARPACPPGRPSAARRSSVPSMPSELDP